MVSGREKVRQALCNLVSQKDSSFFQDPQRFVQVLLQTCTDQKADVEALSLGLQERLPWSIAKFGAGALNAKAVAELAAPLETKRRMSPELARWVVESWAISLDYKVESPAERSPASAPAVSSSPNPAPVAPPPTVPPPLTARGPQASQTPQASQGPKAPPPPPPAHSPSAAPQAAPTPVAPPPLKNGPATSASQAPQQASSTVTGMPSAGAANRNFQPNTNLGIEFFCDDRGLVQIAQVWSKGPATPEAAQSLAAWIKPQERASAPIAPPAAPKTEKNADPAVADANGKPPAGSPPPGSKPNAPAAAPAKTAPKPPPPPPPPPPNAGGGAKPAPKQVRPPFPAPLPTPVRQAPKGPAAPVKTAPQAASGPAPKPAPKAPPPAPPQPRPDIPGSADGQYQLALGYLKGTIGPVNYAEALRIFQMAVSQGHAGAMGKVGEMCLRGWGTKENIPEAAKWFRAAAERGDAEAQVQLGNLYQCGLGVDFDLKEAQKWFQMAADQGNPEARVLIDQILNPK